MSDKLCDICGSLDANEEYKTLTGKGIDSLLKYSVQRNDGLLHKLRDLPVVTVHKKCYKNYTRRIAKSENVYVRTPSSPSRPPLLRSSGVHNFNYRTSCFICAREVPLESSGSGRPRTDRGVSVVTSDSVRDTVMAACEGRMEEWVRKAAIRVTGTSSLVAETACYHRACYASLVKPARSETPSPRSPFLSPIGSGTSTPPEFKTPAKPSAKRPATSPAEGTPSRIPVPKLARGRGRGYGGRSKDEMKLSGFESLCLKLESDDECQFTLSELVAMVPDNEKYSEKHLERLLKDKYKGRVVVVPRLGKSTILCFLGEKFDQLGESWYKSRGKDVLEERKRIVQKAAEIVRSDILAMVHEPEYFPTLGGSGSVVPESLTSFLHTVTSSYKAGRGAEKNVKSCEVLSHCIISATRPRSFISPIMLGLGIWVHRKIGSRTLCDILNKLGFSVSYALIQEYEKAVVIHSRLEFDPEAYLQFAYDNFDFNTDTVDGHGTVHSMGGMVYVTPKSGVPPRGQLPRLTPATRKISLGQYGVIPLQTYSKPNRNGLREITVADLRPSEGNISVAEAQSLSMAHQFDLVWLIGNTANPKVTPGWNGFMSSAMDNTLPFALTATLPLPFVNLNPSDPATITTSLHFAVEKSTKHGQEFCPVTMDQPLFWKAADIILSSAINSPLRKVILRLGGFHLLMSFMGSIGHLMSGSGLETLWATVYAKNSVQHIGSGKAFSRAVRAHFLTQTALLSIVLRLVFDAPEFASCRRDLLEVCRALYCGETKSIEGKQDLLLKVQEKVEERLKGLEASRTGKLWVQYIRQVELMRMLIRAERVGDWSLHLYAVKQMLPYFHAAGHLNYAKSAHLYVQFMETAMTTMPQTERDKLFNQGFFTVRKKNRLWGGNFSDQTIEMDLMRAMKCLGGITMHGRGITESTLAVYVKSMPYCIDAINELEDYCAVSSGTTDQHVELRDSSITRDAEHQVTFRSWLEEHNPFDKPSDQLVCLSSGVIADNSVTCDRAYEIGCAAMGKHIGEPFSEVTFHRKDKAVPMSAMSRSVSVRGSTVQVNPTQLFHRIIVATKDYRDLESHFSYELAPFPTALFDEDGMRKTRKAKLVAAVESLYVKGDSVVPPDPAYVIDGGFLLRKVVWPRLATYKEVEDLYVKHVTDHYGATPLVVFDRYPDGPTTKDQEHNLRAASGTSSNLSAISPDMTITESQARFLSNAKNKTLLIERLTQALQAAGVAVFQAEADADRLIVLKAIELAREKKNSVVVGTDTDLLVLLIGLSPVEEDLPLHFLVPGVSKKIVTKVHHIQSIHSKMGGTAANILVAHPITGTDTVSAMYRGSKKKALEKVCHASLQEHVNTFLQPGQSPDNVAAAGEKILLALYGVSSLPNLNKARFFIYKRTIARQSASAKFLLESLPPTTAGARQHSLRTYFQVQEWLGNDLNPREWGWKLENNQFFPVTTLSPPAPKELLDLISCNCRTGCSRTCSCVTAGLKCSSICGHCAGTSCLNAEENRESEDEDGEEDEEDVDDPEETL